MSAEEDKVEYEKKPNSLYDKIQEMANGVSAEVILGACVNIISDVIAYVNFEKGVDVEAIVENVRQDITRIAKIKADSIKSQQKVH